MERLLEREERGRREVEGRLEAACAEARADRAALEARRAPAVGGTVT
jgi:hypothetical protein